MKNSSQRQYGTDLETAGHVIQLFCIFFPCLCHHRFKCHPSFRTASRTFLLDFWMHGTGIDSIFIYFCCICCLRGRMLMSMFIKDRFRRRAAFIFMIIMYVFIWVFKKLTLTRLGTKIISLFTFICKNFVSVVISIPHTASLSVFFMI